MRVKIESTGGFSGTEMMVAKYDTDELPKEQADRVREAVERLSEDDGATSPGEIGADLPSYRITIGDPDDDPKVFEICGERSEERDALLATLLQGPAEPKERPEEAARRESPPSPSGL
ncbi:protealysin inhibitor emfourin [Actinomadura kijaniata]|uniref:protealysin inhibitor emfourin n=1 Tax=Actinomadura kijaniata TaxID=46161 RepID=UPI000A6B09CE|nr:protealysin inhibitor emfourin [Actinomadura kijaniata]